MVTTVQQDWNRSSFKLKWADRGPWDGELSRIGDWMKRLEKVSKQVSSHSAIKAIGNYRGKQTCEKENVISNRIDHALCSKQYSQTPIIKTLLTDFQI